MSNFVTFEKMVAVTPSDSDDLSADDQNHKALYSGDGGDIACVFQDNSTATVTVPAGGLLPVKVKRVNSASTTATQIFIMKDI